MHDGDGDEARKTQAAPRIAAHRGGAGLWAENALSAFRNAIALGVDLIELDVHLTSDGVPVVIHDPTLKRTTSGRGRVHTFLEAELAELRLLGKKKAPLDEGVPSLSSVLELVAPSNAGLLVELKVAGAESSVVELVAAKQLLDRATIMSFDRDVARNVARLTPRARAGALVRRASGLLDGNKKLRALLGELSGEGVQFLGIHHRGCSPKVIELVSRSGITLGAWTISSLRRLRKVMAIGVEVVITDRPDRALVARAELARDRAPKLVPEPPAKEPMRRFRRAPGSRQTP